MNIIVKAFACIGIAALCGAASAPESAEQLNVPFSDPSRPGTLHVSIVTGSIVVKGSATRDVIVETRGGEDPRRNVPGNAKGLRQLQQRPSISVEEQNNRMEIGSQHSNRRIDFEIEVPARTHLELSTVNSGDIRVDGVEGEIEISNVNGAIALTNVAGSVVAHTVNGRVSAVLSRVAPEKTMAFTSLNGDVDIDLPADIKANLRLRTDNGKVFTDFDLNMLPQPASTVIEDTRRTGGRYRIEGNKVIYGAVNGGGPDVEMRTFNGSIFVRKNR